MKITREIKIAIEKAIQSRGTRTALGTETGLHFSIFGKYLSGEIKSIDDETWDKLEPALRPYLPAQPRPNIPPSPATQQSIFSPPPPAHEFPVISFAQATGFDPILEPFDTYLLGCGEDTFPFYVDPKPGMFALRVDGDSMSPEFPHGTIILVQGGVFAERGDTVVAKFRETGQVVCKRYQRRDNIITLESINPGGQCFEWNCKEEKEKLVWMWPVLQAQIDLRRKRHEQFKNGAF